MSLQTNQVSHSCGVCYKAHTTPQLIQQPAAMVHLPLQSCTEGCVLPLTFNLGKEKNPPELFMGKTSVRNQNQTKRYGSQGHGVGLYWMPFG